MKKLLASVLILGGFVISGCYAGAGSPIPGLLYTEIKAPKEGLADAADTKEGVAICKSILGLVALGDCSIEAAKKAGGISKVQYADVEVKNILGIYAEYAVIARGQ